MMTAFPLILTDLLGHWESYIVYVLIGMAFGAVLEMAGFGNSKKLAAQFYFKEQTVLKVMFTGIVVAMLLILFTSAIGLLDYNLIWVNPTYLVPGIVGGLIMGAGFIIGGFCPGTSIVATATLKLDGLFFLIGAFFGIFAFGETVQYYEDFWKSSNMGRYTLQELFGVDAGIVALGIVFMALFMFWGAEKLEDVFGDKDKIAKPQWRYYAAGGLVLMGLVLVGLGQPTSEDRWNWIKDEKQAQLDAREIQIHPAELLKISRDHRLNTIILDVRSDADYNQFHIRDAQHAPLGEIKDWVEDLQAEPANTVIIVLSNDEAAATETWKTLISSSVQNVYILEGGVNNWIAIFGDADFQTEHPILENVGDDQLGYTFSMALGSRYSAADPNPDMFEEIIYTEKVKLQSKQGGAGGGCG